MATMGPLRFHVARHLHASRSRLARSPRVIPPIVSTVRQQNLTYLDEVALASLYKAVRTCEARGVPGCVIEAGCAVAGSAIVMAAAKNPARPMFIYDVFDMIPAPGPRDGEDVHRRYEVIARGGAQGLGGDRYYGYRPDLLGEVRGNFARLGLAVQRNAVTLVPGLFEETLNPAGDVAFAHIDGDWYDSVHVALQRILPRMAPGAVTIVDDYFAWSGCYDAVNDVCRGLGRDYVVHRWRYPRLRIGRRP